MNRFIIVFFAVFFLAALPVHAQTGNAKSQAEIESVLATNTKRVNAAKARVKKRFTTGQIKAFAVEERAIEDRADREARKRYPNDSQNVRKRITLQRTIEEKYQAQLRKKWQLSHDEWIALLGL